MLLLVVARQVDAIHQRALEHGAVIANVASTGAIGVAVANTFTHFVNPVLTAFGLIVAVAYHGTQLLESRTVQKWIAKWRGK